MGVDIHWGILGNTPDIGERFNAGFQVGQQRVQQQQQQNALGKYAQTRDPTALNALAAAGDPMTALQLGERDEARRARDSQAQLEQHRERIAFGAKLIEQIRPQDDAGWQQVLAGMRQYGFDVSDVPPTFDPQYVEGVRSIGRTMQSPEAGFTLGEGQVRYDATGNVIARGSPKPPRYIPLPPGGRLVLDPASGGTVMDNPAPAPTAAAPTNEAALRSAARQAIDAGADPAAVNARLEQMLKGGAAPATGPANFQP